MWGSTEPDTDKPCDWETTPFNDGHKTFNEDYFESIKNKVCQNGILASEYDAATIILGNDWWLPTADDFRELIDNTKHEWVENYQGSKINGMIFTSKNSNNNGAELFIPGAGYRNGSSLIDRGSYVDLWSSSLDTNHSWCASGLHFNNSSCDMRNIIRCYGFCLRGVKEK